MTTLTKSGAANEVMMTSVRPRRRGIYRNPVVHRWLRTLHRAFGLVGGVFMFVIGATGSIIQIERFYGPGSHTGNGLLPSKLHMFVMDLHTAFIFGKPGIVLTVLTASALIYFSVSGIWFYIVLCKMWFKQLKSAKRPETALSPSSTSQTMRTIHRWITVPTAAYMVFIAISGVGMVPVLWQQGHMPWSTSTSAVGNDAKAALQEKAVSMGLDLPPLVARPPRARPTTPDTHLTWLPWVARGSRDTIMTTTTPQGTHIPFWVGRDGELWFIIHTGEVLALPGKILVLIAGLSLVAFSISGFWMYFSMYAIERAKGNNNMMWH